MKKVQVDIKLDDAQKKQFESISNEFEFVYGSDNYDADILVGSINPAKIKDYKHPKLVLSTWVGYDAFIKKGVLEDYTVLCNGVDVHTEEVAEHTFCLLLSMLKNLHEYKDNQRKHDWKDMGTVKSYTQLKVAILGLGNIGKHLAKHCKALGMYVIGIKRNIDMKIDVVDELKTLDDLDDILPRVDAVLSVLPSNKQTYHLFTLDRFKLMKKDALLINTGRGDLIDSDVLYEVLDKRIIKGIGQDVFEIEPLSKDSKLWDLDNLVITPHVAGFFHLDLARQKFVDICCDNLRRYINNEELLNVVLEREV